MLPAQLAPAVEIGGSYFLSAPRRRFGEVYDELAPFGLVRIHRSYAVHPERVLELRMRDRSVDWELRLEPPVNRVLPIARGRREEVLEAIRNVHRR